MNVICQQGYCSVVCLCIGLDVRDYFCTGQVCVSTYVFLYVSAVLCFKACVCVCGSVCVFLSVEFICASLHPVPLTLVCVCA